MAFDTKQYSWSNIEVFFLGRTIRGIRRVMYKVSQEKEHVHGAGDKPLAIQPGNKTYEGEITLLQSELEALTRAAGAGNDVTDIPPFDIVVNYMRNGVLVTDIIKGVEFTESEKGMSQNDKYMEITLPFLALDIEKGV